jgi:Ca2+-transporting ATPase
LGLPAGAIPLIAIQILYVNLAMDGLPAIALSVDPPEGDIMERPPRPRKETVFSGEVLQFLLGAGVWTGVVALAVFLWAVHQGRPLVEAQGLCFVTLILVQFFNAFNCRSPRHSLFEVGVFSNRWLWLAILWEVVVLMLVLYVPFLQAAFHTFSFSGRDWTIAITSAISIFVLAELYKLVLAMCGRRTIQGV